jgi:hypothetical protein
LRRDLYSSVIVDLARRLFTPPPFLKADELLDGRAGRQQSGAHGHREDFRLGSITPYFAFIDKINSASFMPVDCLIASVASDTPISFVTSSVHLPADFKDSTNFPESFTYAALLAAPMSTTATSSSSVVASLFKAWRNTSSSLCPCSEPSK